MGNPYDVLKVLLGPPYGPYKGPLWPFIPPEKVAIFLLKKGAFLLKKVAREGEEGATFSGGIGLDVECREILFHLNMATFSGGIKGHKGLL